MPPSDDTIVALSSVPGPGARAIVRLSGPKALAVAERVLRIHLPSEQQHSYPAQAALPGVHSPFPVDVHVWPAPRTYTGEDIAELHTPGCPPLVDLLIAQCLDGGARAARRGEFTMRAFLAGKLDLPRAEAVLAVIDAGGRDELTQALAQLAGGVA